MRHGDAVHGQAARLWHGIGHSGCTSPITDAENKTDTNEAASWCLFGPGAPGGLYHYRDGRPLERQSRTWQGSPSNIVGRARWCGLQPAKPRQKSQSKALPWTELPSAGCVFERPGDEEMWLDSFLESQTAGWTTGPGSDPALEAGNLRMVNLDQWNARPGLLSLCVCVPLVD